MIHVPQRNIIQRAFAITPEQNIPPSSCFLFPVNGVAYLITAAHVIKSKKHRTHSELFIYKNNVWLKINIIPHFLSERSYVDGDIDLVIIKTSTKLESNQTDINLSSTDAILGQDVYFLGFPYLGNPIQYIPEKINDGFPLPFIKNAILSKVQYPLFYLDGHNNPGFSGGPVIFWNYKENTHKVLGIISCYINQQSVVKNIETSNTYIYPENSGIAIAYDVDCINKFMESEDWKDFVNEKI